MNGRIYDAVLGRFLSADPQIQAPGNLQSYNRYSYTLNNPLRYDDPSGYGWLSKKWKQLKKGVKKIEDEFRRLGRSIEGWGPQIRRSGRRLDDSVHKRLNNECQNGCQISYNSNGEVGFQSENIDFAYTPEPDDPQGVPVTSTDGGSSGSSGGGNSNGNCPINFATGEKFLIVKDYQATGASKLKFERHYSSEANETTGLGKGWRHNFDKKLVFVGGNNNPIEVNAIREQNESINFVYLIGEGFSVAPGKFSQLEKTTEGWQLKLEDNSVELYSPEGELLAIHYLGGYQQALHYQSVILADDTILRRLIKISDSYDQQLELVYNEKGQLDTVFANSKPTTQYGYDRHANLAQVLYPDSTPGNSADNPALAYRYEDKRFPHAITSVWDESGQQVHEMAYNNHGRAVLSKVDGSGYCSEPL